MRKIILIILVIYPLQTFAQDIVRRNLFYDNLNFFNPAVNCTDSIHSHQIEIYGKYKFANSGNNWNKPINLSAEYQGCSKKNGGGWVGGYSFDGYSYFNRHSIFGGYSYKWNFAHQQFLSIGANLIFNLDGVGWDRFEGGIESGNQYFFTPDMDLGIQYGVKGFRIGLSVKNLIGTKQLLASGVTAIEDKRTFYINAAYEFHLRGNYMIAPIIMLECYESVIGNIGVFASLKNIIELSYYLRINEVRHVFCIQGNILDTAYIGLSYDISHFFSDMNLDFRIGYRF